MSVIETRAHQMFPELDAGQIKTAKRFASGPAREFAPGENAVMAIGLESSLEGDKKADEVKNQIF